MMTLRATKSYLGQITHEEYVGSRLYVTALSVTRALAFAITGMAPTSALAGELAKVVRSGARPSVPPQCLRVRQTRGGLSQSPPGGPRPASELPFFYGSGTKAAQGGFPRGGSNRRPRGDRQTLRPRGVHIVLAGYTVMSEAGREFGTSTETDHLKNSNR